MAKVAVVAVAWFRAEDYQRIREISDDDMIATFEEFEAKMAEKIAGIEARGVRCDKVIVNPDQLQAFAARVHAGHIDTKVRAEFAAMLVQQKRSAN